MNAIANKPPGFDGNSPEFMPARDVSSRDPLTGRIVRETPDGPQNVNVDRVAWLFAHDKIDARQHSAANRLQRDWERSQISPCASTLGNLVAGGGRHEFTPADSKIAAGKAYHDAIVALGRWLRIVELVVLENHSIQKAAAMLRIHRERASLSLEMGLDELAAHYGLPKETAK